MTINLPIINKSYTNLFFKKHKNHWEIVGRCNHSVDCCK